MGIITRAMMPSCRMASAGAGSGWPSPGCCECPKPQSKGGRRMLAQLDAGVLPPGIRSRFVEDVNGLRIHMLEAGFETAGRPCLLLLHGFPELAYSWRKVM